MVVVASGGKNGPWTGVTFHDGDFFVAEGGILEGGRILRITPSGQVSAIVADLPSYGDHHTDGPTISPDGWVYFGQGTASNSGIVGEDNLKFGWLKRRPDFHDIPGEDITLVGHNVETKDFVHPSTKRTVRTGAFVPFGTPTHPNQVIRGQTNCSGSVLRVRPNGENLELVAWGFRNPFGLAFSPSGCFTSQTMASMSVAAARSGERRTCSGKWNREHGMAGPIFQAVNRSTRNGSPRPENHVQTSSSRGIRVSRPSPSLDLQCMLQRMDLIFPAAKRSGTLARLSSRCLETSHPPPARRCTRSALKWSG